MESGLALVQDCMVAGNSLTGLSVVRGGRVHLLSCDVTENGTDPIAIEDTYVNTIDLGNIIDHQPRGGVYIGNNDNNFESISHHLAGNDDNNKYIIVHGSRVRQTNSAFLHSIYSPVFNWEYHYA